MENANLSPKFVEIIEALWQADEKGKKVYKKKLDTSEYGIAGTTFTLANEINMGRYTIRASLDDYSVEKKVEVKRYVLPKFKIDFKTDRTYYLPNQTLKGEINTNYFFGKATNDAKVKVEVRTYEVNMELLKVINEKIKALQAVQPKAPIVFDSAGYYFSSV